MTTANEAGFCLEKDFFESMVALSPDAIIAANRKGLVTLFNEAAEVLTGWKIDQVLNKMHVTQLYHPPELAREVKKMIHLPDHGGVGKLKNMEVVLKTREGRSVPIMLSAVVFQNKGVEAGSVGFFHDLTRTKQLEEISITDDLTGLHNRHHFHSLLAKELDRSMRYNRPLTLLYLDLDKFKPFNDSFGHAQGDNILRLVGKCARQLLRIQDDAFRLGGDEFAMLLVETDLAGGMLVADRFRKAFNEQWFRAMSATGNKLSPVSLSLGVAQYHNKDENGNQRENADNLVKRADMAMYEAKRAGGDRVVKASAYIGEKD